MALIPGRGRHIRGDLGHHLRRARMPDVLQLWHGAATVVIAHHPGERDHRTGRLVVDQCRGVLVDRQRPLGHRGPAHLGFVGPVIVLGLVVAAVQLVKGVFQHTVQHPQPVRDATVDPGRLTIRVGARQRRRPP